MAKALMPILAIICLALVVFLQFGFIFLMLALAPSLVAFFIDREPGKPTFKVVIACNLAATMPSLAPMLQATMHAKHYDVSTVMSDPTVWLFVLSGAAAGWCLIYLCRFIGRFIYTLVYEYNIATLENVQKHLVEEWGQQVRQPPGL
jgi:hypothetical protein